MTDAMRLSESSAAAHPGRRREPRRQPSGAAISLVVAGFIVAACLADRASAQTFEVLFGVEGGGPPAAMVLNTADFGEPEPSGSDVVPVVGDLGFDYQPPPPPATTNAPSGLSGGSFESYYGFYGPLGVPTGGSFYVPTSGYSAEFGGGFTAGSAAEALRSTPIFVPSGFVPLGKPRTMTLDDTDASNGPATGATPIFVPPGFVPLGEPRTMTLDTAEADSLHAAIAQSQMQAVELGVLGSLYVGAAFAEFLYGDDTYGYASPDGPGTDDGVIHHTLAMFAPPANRAVTNLWWSTNGYYYNLCIEEPDDPICDDFWDFYDSPWGPRLMDFAWSMGTEFSQLLHGEWPLGDQALPHYYGLRDVSGPAYRDDSHGGTATVPGTATPPPNSSPRGKYIWTPSAEEEYKRTLTNETNASGVSPRGEEQPGSHAVTPGPGATGSSDALTSRYEFKQQPLNGATTGTGQTTGFTGRQDLLDESKASVTPGASGSSDALTSGYKFESTGFTTRDKLLQDANTAIQSQPPATPGPNFRDTTGKPELEEKGRTSPRFEQRTGSKPQEGGRNIAGTPTLNKPAPSSTPFTSQGSHQLGGFGGLGGGMHSGGGTIKGGSTLRRE